MGLLRYGSGLGAFADSFMKTYMGFQENERANRAQELYRQKMAEEQQENLRQENLRQAQMQEILAQARQREAMTAAAQKEAANFEAFQNAIRSPVPVVSGANMMRKPEYGGLLSGQAAWRPQNLDEQFSTALQYMGPDKAGVAMQTRLSAADRAQTQMDIAELRKQQAEALMRLRDDWERRRDETARRGQDIKIDLGLGKIGNVKPPVGYRYTKDGNLESIPGGPADVKMDKQRITDTISMTNLTDSLNRLASSANELKNHPGLGRVTGVIGSLPNVPGSQASNADALLTALQSQVGFAVLQAMRDASKTGGALGQISDKENEILQNNLAALNKKQDLSSFKKNLDKIIQYTDDAKKRIRGAYDMKYNKEDEDDQPVQTGKRFTIKRVK